MCQLGSSLSPPVHHAMQACRAWPQPHLQSCEVEMAVGSTLLFHSAPSEHGLPALGGVHSLYSRRLLQLQAVALHGKL